MLLTRQQRVDSLSVTGGLLVKERLSMEVDTLEVFGRTHVDQVPAHKLVGIHPQALQAVYNAIDGLGNNRQKDIFFYQFWSGDYFSVLLLTSLEGMEEKVSQLVNSIHNNIF